MIFSFFGNPHHLKLRCAVGHKNFKLCSTTYHFSGTLLCVFNKNNKIFVNAPIKIVPQIIIISYFQAWNYLTEWIDIFFLWKSTSPETPRSVTFTRTSIHALPHTIFHPLYDRLCVVFFTQKIWGPSIVTIFTFVI